MRSIRPSLAFAAILAASACSGKDPPPWPSLPRSGEAARALIRERTARDLDGAGDAQLEAPALLAALARDPAALVAGEGPITRWIQAFLDGAAARDAYVIWGGYHDAGGQVDAFRRLIGPGGLHGLTVVAVEPLRAGGSWQGVPAEAQRGDGAEIAAYLDRGDGAAFESLSRRHAEADYAAWKFGYEASVLELLVTARATGTRLLGCDMPAETQALLAGVDDASRLRLRELHCLSSLPPSPRPRRAALLWGQAHARAGGLRRFLPREAAALAIFVFGHRSGAWTTESALGADLALTDPVLVPLGPSEAALFYPAGPLAADVDRVRAAPSATAPGLVVRLEGPTAGTLRIGARSFPIGPEAQRLDVSGDAAYLLEVGKLRFLGAIHVPPGGSLELTFDPARRALALVEHPAR